MKELVMIFGTIGQKWQQYKGFSPTPLVTKKNQYYDIQEQG
jgi:hypothetical protein